MSARSYRPIASAVRLLANCTDLAANPAACWRKRLADSRRWCAFGARRPLLRNGPFGLLAISEPHIEYRVLYRIEAGALGKHPTGEDAFLVAIEQYLVDFDKRGGLRRLGRWAGKANARRYLQCAEFHRLIEGHFEAGNARGDLVEGGKYGNAVFHALSVHT